MIETIIKRDEKRVKFTPHKISEAMRKAFEAIGAHYTQTTLDYLTESAILGLGKKKTVDIERVQDEVERVLMQAGYGDVARAYIKYRHNRQLARRQNTTDDSILSLLKNSNKLMAEENSNKDTSVASTQRDYIAGIVSADITNRLLLPTKISAAHEEGILHFHDADYFIQDIFNCFNAKTEFVTAEGIRQFKDFKDGEEVTILNKDGKWEKAYVRHYGKQIMQDVTFRSSRSIKTVVCTADHRWILEDETITTNLKVGDKLIALPDIKDNIEPSTLNEIKAWCLGFVIGDGSDAKKGLQVRLCGDKIKYIDRFIKAGYATSGQAENGDIFLYKLTKMSKQKFLSSEAWLYMSNKDKQMLFSGYYAADGSIDRNLISTADDRIADMIEDLSATCGYHISSHKIITHDTNYKKNATLHEIRFRKHQQPHHKWVVEKIEPHHKADYPSEAWCVEALETHSFTLANGMVTGNCCLCNISDMLDNGTIINKKRIDSPKSFRVACTVTSQIIACVASNQYGGQSVDLYALGKYLRKSKDKFEKRIRKNAEESGIPESMIESFVAKQLEAEIKDELASGIQTLQYQINTLMTTNGQTPFVTLFLYLRPDDPYVKENAMIIEEILRQRIKGIKNESGVYVTPAFPKLVYVLDEHNNLTGGPYDYLTKLAVECTAQRMYPDYISAKKMKENYEGNVFSPMGCIDGNEKIVYKLKETTYVESFERAWQRLGTKFQKRIQGVKCDNPQDYMFMDTPGMLIYDVKQKDFVPCKRIIRNKADKWAHIKFESGHEIDCTLDHPFDTENRGVVKAENLTTDDIVAVRTKNTNDKKWIETKVESVEPYDETKFSYDVTTKSKHFQVSNINSHNCRSFLSPWKDENGEYKFEGRFNQGVVSINLPQIGIIADGDEDKFWSLLNERLNLCYEALMCRHKALLNTTSDVSPIHWQHGAIARLPKGTPIKDMLYGGYSTLSLGYIGLYECVYAMKHMSHTEKEGEEFAIKILTHLKETCAKWKKDTNIGFALYGTPAESLCYRFAKIDKNKFGDIPNVTDKGYYTNSYHVDVREPISLFDKFMFENQFQPISTGGCISYAEIPNMRNNLEALEECIRFIYDNIQYAEFNTKDDVCNACGFKGEIKVNDDNEWECPNCHCKDKRKMTIVRRTCGYLGENFWNTGKTKEIAKRVEHL